MPRCKQSLQAQRYIQNAFNRSQFASQNPSDKWLNRHGNCFCREWWSIVAKTRERNRAPCHHHEDDTEPALFPRCLSKTLAEYQFYRFFDCRPQVGWKIGLLRVSMIPAKSISLGLAAAVICPRSVSICACVARVFCQLLPPLLRFRIFWRCLLFRKIV